MTKKHDAGAVAGKPVQGRKKSSAVPTFLFAVGGFALASIVMLVYSSMKDDSSPAGPSLPPSIAPAAAPRAFPQPPGPVPEGKVWSPEHGHWHDLPSGAADGGVPHELSPVEGSEKNPATGLYPQPPGPVPEGKVWSPEHGHWHDASWAAGRAATPGPTAVEGAQRDAETGLFIQPEGPVPDGKIWSPEHGHWHTAPAGADANGAAASAPAAESEFIPVPQAESIEPAAMEPEADAGRAKRPPKGARPK